MDVQNKRVLVVGLARSGLAVARALARRGAVVTVTDRKPPAEFRDVLPELLKDKIGLELGSQRVETFLRHEIIVISPGVPWDLPQLKRRASENIPVYPEVEAAVWFLDGRWWALPARTARPPPPRCSATCSRPPGFPTFVGGNIGNALSSAVDHADARHEVCHRVEQLSVGGHSRIPAARGGDAEHFAQPPGPPPESGSLCAGQAADFPQSGRAGLCRPERRRSLGGRASGRRCASRPVLFSRRRELPTGVFASGGKIYYRVRHLERVLFETRDVTPAGRLQSGRCAGGHHRGVRAGRGFCRHSQGRAGVSRPSSIAWNLCAKFREWISTTTPRPPALTPR